MSAVATPQFLAQLKSYYPQKTQSLQNPWYIVASAAFCASNLPDAVPLVYEQAQKDLGADEDPLLLVRKIKDALLKSGMLCGYPKVCFASRCLRTKLDD